MKQRALYVLKKLQDNGYIAYFAGGCVRDMLMGKEPHDFDIVTSAKPDEVENMFKKTIPVGKEFGVIIAHVGPYDFEIATFRSEGRYSDARRPDQVFWADAEADAKRRDFTINGIFYNPINNTIHDYIDGHQDIKNRIVRFIGVPEKRIQEDNLRILRAIRFKNNLQFNYDEKTKIAVKQNANLINNVSNERILDELNKMIANPARADSFQNLLDLDLLKYLIPEAAKMVGVKQPDEFHLEGDVWVHTMKALKSLPAKTPEYLAWAVFFHDIGKPETISYPKTKQDRIRFNRHVKVSADIALQIMERLGFPAVERKLIVWLVENHMILGDIPKMREAKRRRLLSDPRFPALLRLHKADALGSKPTDLTMYNQNLKLYEEVEEMHLTEKKKPKHIPLLSGTDLINLGIPEGPIVGKILHQLENAQLEGKIKTSKEASDVAKRLNN